MPRRARRPISKTKPASTSRIQKQLQQEEQAGPAERAPAPLNRLQKVLTDYASKNGYSVIMEARSVPYFDAKLDMTKAIQQEFDRSK